MRKKKFTADATASGLPACQRRGGNRAAHKHLTWSRPGTEPRAGGSSPRLPSVTGTGKHGGADGTSLQFDPEVNFRDYALHRCKSFDWKTLLVPHGDATYDKAALHRLEAVAAGDDTAFGRALHGHLAARGEEDIRRSSLNLPAMLQLLRADHTQVKGAWIYINASRGLDLLPDGVDIPASECDNYSSATQDWPDMVSADIKRLAKHEFVMSWGELAEEMGITDAKPRVVHSLGAVMRNGKVRIVIDASTGEHKDMAVNDLMHVDGKTCFATIDQAKRAMARQGSVARSDLVDAFLQTPLSARSVKLCGFKWPDENGVMQYWGYRTLGFGFSMGPYWQQCLAVMLCRAVILQCRELGVNTTVLPEYDAHQAVPTPAVVGQQLTAVLALLDDFAFFGTSRKVTHFAWARFLYITGTVGIVVSPKPGKTDPPCVQLVYLGIEIRLRSLTVRLHDERVVAMRARLQELQLRQELSKKELQSIIGVLVFAAAVIRCGRPAYRHLLDLLRSHGRGSSGKFTLDDAARGDIAMWLVLLNALNERSVISGVRMPVLRWHVYTDASYTGWGWTAGFGAWDAGTWPASWASRMGDSKYRSIWICEAEILCVAFAVRYLAPRMRGAVCVFHIDNLPVVNMLKKHSSRSRRCAAVVAEIEWAAAVYGFEIRPVHIRTYDNVLADEASRKDEPGFDTAKFESHLNELTQECAERFPSTPRECAPERPDLVKLWQEHIVQLDVWEDELSASDQEELERLLPEYLRCEGLTSALRADGLQCARQREQELAAAAPTGAEAVARAQKAAWYQRQREGPRKGAASHSA